MNHITGRASSDEEKEQVIAHLLLLWKQWPDMRLGQLIGNVYCSDTVLYYVEDWAMINKLETVYDSLESQFKAISERKE